VTIEKLDAAWIRVPIEEGDQARSDYGLMDCFNLVVVRIEDGDGIEGFGETRAHAGSLGSNHALLSLLRDELAPTLLGRDPSDITRIFEGFYNGVRADYATLHGRSMPAIGARGMGMCAISAIDMALWDLHGRRLGQPLWRLLGGRLRDRLPLYASGGWGDEKRIGEELLGYVRRGFKAVKMRVGVKFGDVGVSIARVRAAREAIGPDIPLMVDAHGTYGTAEAKRFAREAEPYALRWFEEPVSPDNLQGLAEVRAATSIPIASGETEHSRFAFRDLMLARSVDVVQPDLAWCGGLTEGMRIAALASAHQVEIAPHAWGGGLLLAASAHLAAISPAFAIQEFPAATNPVYQGLVREPWRIEDGALLVPDGPGLGVTVDRDLVDNCRVA
jgi:L-alanine-DL-glutamate epimerase-like enolase superfamily enzyme